jgi:hypothetical protein
MSSSRQFRGLIRYLIAVAASAAALALVSALAESVGSIPLLLLPVVALMERYADSGPAVLTTALCRTCSGCSPT